jgi:hypothetical protein
VVALAVGLAIPELQADRTALTAVVAVSFKNSRRVIGWLVFIISEYTYSFYSDQNIAK